MTLAVKSWKNVDFFRDSGYYDKVIGLLRMVDRGGGVEEMYVYMDIEEPGLFSDENRMYGAMVKRLLSELLGFVDLSGEQIGLTNEARTLLDNHRKGQVDYNKQLVFLYLARSSGGFIDIFYALRSGEPSVKEQILQQVNAEREREGFPPRKRWRDFRERLEWSKEMGIVIESEDGAFSLTVTGRKLLDWMENRDVRNREENALPDSAEPGPVEVREMTEMPKTSLSQEPKEFRDSISGPIKNRRFGIRIDDDVTVYIVGGDTLRVIEGRVLQHKSGLHLIDTDGYYHRISYDWVTDIVVKRHNRLHPKDDDEYAKKKKKKRKAPKPKESHGLNNSYV